ncbi:MAG TPA: hypothetical protein VLC79_09365 [Cellvibrio sp.]|nr:hypothetical protein [Cellvibrio sp.]
MENKNPINYGLTPFDLYQKLIFEEKRLSSNAEWSSYDFFNFHVTATHLFDDWLKEEKKESQSLMIKIRNTPREMFVVLQVLRDLTNGNKHRKLDNPSEEKRITNISGRFSDGWYSFYFSRFSIKTTDFQFQIWDLVAIVMGYFHWIFDHDVSNTIFPERLIDMILSFKK